MVYSASNRTSSIASITNQFTGGGNKKAGSARAVNVAMRLAFNQRGLPQPMSVMILPLSSTTISSRGVGWRFPR